MASAGAVPSSPILPVRALEIPGWACVTDCLGIRIVARPAMFMRHSYLRTVPNGTLANPHPNAPDLFAIYLARTGGSTA